MPGLTLYTGNRLETLQQKLTRQLQAKPLPPLQREIVIVQSKGMQRWLSLEIARQCGICAHLEYLFPKAFVYSLFRQIAQLPETSPYAPEIMTWLILKHLSDLADLPGADSLQHYISNDSTGLKKYQLATEIASLFERYIIMRPEMTTRWDRGDTRREAIFKESHWQAALWQMLSADTASSDGPIHHAALKNFFLKTEAPILDLPDRISVFGISTLPPFYIDIFSKIARQVAVDIYYLNPCREYWEYAYSSKQIARFTQTGLYEEDTYYDSGNSLLGSMGSAGREFFSLILSRVGDTGEDLFMEPGNRTLLASLQSDILNLEQPRAGDARPVPRDDSSIQIHACHSRFREVEVLHDLLLHQMDSQPELRPTDIVVMMPDVTAYAPLVQAVFDAPENETKKIPYSIADTLIRSSNRLADTFLALLSLDRTRYRTPAVLDLLEVRSVRRQFGIFTDDLELIKTWVTASGICWGIDGRHRESLGLPGFHENSWQFGLERLLLGYALPPDRQPDLFADILPYGDIEGDGARILGAFTRFVQALFTCCQALDRPRSPARWAARLEEVLDTFFINDETTADDFNQVRDTLTDTGLSGFTALAGFEETISIDVVRAYLEKRIGGQVQPFGFISRGVTFCTLLPMRSIPFKVVYMLGMNDGEFPRSNRTLGFDLMEKNRQLCDWSKRHEDRHLFLESILSARQKFIISYVGRSLKDNTDLPPSVLVGELLDYLAEGYTASDGRNMNNHVFTKHPLQPFSPLYFQGNGRLFSYSEQNCQAARQSLATDRLDETFPGAGLPPLTGTQWDTLGIGQLCRFFYNPAEFLARNRLHIYYELDDSGTLEEREPFELDSLQAYLIKNELADALLEGGDPDTWYAALRASGRLPHGRMGQTVFAGYQDEVQQFVDRVSPHRAGPAAPPVDLRIQLQGPVVTRLQGRLENLYTGGQLFFRCATVKVKDMLKAWVYHLALNAAPPPGQALTTTVIGADSCLAFKEVGTAAATAVLGKLVDCFREGLQEPLCFFPQTSYAYAEAIFVKGQSVAQAIEAARRKWYPGYYPGEGENLYLSRSFGSDLPETTAFQETALAVFEPLLAALPEEH